jgi:hypothetical protein
MAAIGISADGLEVRAIIVTPSCTTSTPFPRRLSITSDNYAHVATFD